MPVSDLYQKGFKIKKTRRKIEKKTLFFVLGVIILFIFLIIGGQIKKSNQPVSELSEQTIIEVEESPWEIKEHLIQSGEVFSKLNTALGLNSQQLQEILIATKDVYDLAQIKAGHKIKSFFLKENGQWEKIEYEIDKDNFLIISQSSDNSLKAEKLAIPYQIELVRVRGEVEENFYLSAQKTGLKDKTIMEVADIFAWDIDFGLEVRKGDQFEILYEKRTLEGEEVNPGKILIARYQNQGKDFWGMYYHDSEGRIDYYDLEGKCLRKQFLKAPINYRYISSGYSLHRYHPVWNVYTPHQAIDYAAACGTPVASSGAGTVIFAGWKNNVYGYTVEIRHGGVYETRYSHLSAFAQGIRYGVNIRQGQIIGFVGTTGTSTGCHLDYAMKKYGQHVNPLTQNFDPIEPIKEAYRGNFEWQKEIYLKLLKEN